MAKAARRRKASRTVSFLVRVTVAPGVKAATVKQALIDGLFAVHDAQGGGFFSGTEYAALTIREVPNE